MKAVIYARVSTVEQEYERQIKELKKYCDYQNLEITKEFAEKQSGTIEAREELLNMLQFVENKENNIKFVVVHELSRLGRTSEVIRTIEKLNKLQICLISLKENIKTLNEDLTVNHSASLILSILSSINSFELSTMKYRSMSGMLNSVRNGNARGVINYGYTKEKGGKKLIIHEEQAEIVKLMFQMYIEGNGTRKIANYLNNNNIPTQYATSNRKKEFITYKKVGYTKQLKDYKWTESTITCILKSQIYTGERPYKNEIVPAPQIIDKETFDKVQQLFKDNFMKQGINQKYTYLFNSGKIKCGICGKNYYIETRKDVNRSMYKCMSIRYNDNCGNYCINYDKLNKGIFETFNTEVLLKGELIKSLTDSDNQTAKIDSITAKIEEISTQLSNADKAEKKLLDLFVDGNLNKKLYNEKATEIKERVSKLKKEKSGLVAEKQDIIDFIAKQKEAIENISLFDDVSQNKNTQLLKDSLNSLIQKIVLYPIRNDVVHKKMKNDRFLYVEIYSYLRAEPFTFGVSQRTTEYPPFFSDLFNKETFDYDSVKSKEREITFIIS